jgi:hypothetical protein
MLLDISTIITVYIPVVIHVLSALVNWWTVNKATSNQSSSPTKS